MRLCYIKVNHSTSNDWCQYLLKIAGFWPPEPYNGWKLVLYFCHTCLMFGLLLGLYIIIQIVDFFMVWGNIQAMTGDAFLLFTNLVQTTKIFNMIMKRRVIYGIISDIKDLIRTQTSPREINLINSYAALAMKEFLFYFSFTSFIVTLWILGPVLSKVNDTRMLPLSGWYPYNNKITPAYEMTYAHQAIALYMAANLNVVKDCFASGLINQITCQFALLRLSLENITNDFKKQCVRENGELKSKNETEAEEYLYEKLKSCIIQHQKILIIVNNIEECFSMVTLFQFTVSLMIICVTAFQLILQGGNGIVQILGIGTYLLDMIYQVFLYCSHGNELIIQSKEIQVSAYFSGWYDCSPRFKHALRALMARSSRPVMLTAGGFVTLSYETFTGIMKASYSFFTVLQQIDDPAI